ncbi:insulinoma-associated protein 2 [Spea bombifrons]|uniref:insulinoma-associated protein 2 n=1 Tax=Spea bombifrons TaxID=233779 RepID=UPI00234B7584|nr:insulinoma-associated protein 2 [Spea bombifrons]
MPRGFLVKRTRKSCGSYRIPSDETGPTHYRPIATALNVLTPYTSTSDFGAGAPDNPVEKAGEGTPEASSDVPPIRLGSRVEQIGPWNQIPFSPVKPVDMELKKTFFRRFLSSPASAESFPSSESFASMEKLLAQHNPFLPPESSKLQTSISAKETPRYPKLQCKKIKASRKLSFADEVTTSPVLGLKIKAEEPDGKSLLKRPPLGEFICQLCKEQYPDPFALAQHKCSRIVRVEYRCPECEKIFSCPANLASHRRWHKPRALGADGQGGKRLQVPLDGKENSSGRRDAAPSARDQHQPALDSSQQPAQPLHSGGSPYQVREGSMAHTTAEDGAFDCPYCHKRFRRHTYLRKHLLTHQPFNPLERGQITYPCPLCGVHFPSADIRDKHRLWHAVREELLIPLEEAMVAEGGGGQQIFPCEICPTAFFSAPGLTLHINKCHPPESRQELIQQIPIGPGC